MPFFLKLKKAKEAAAEHKKEAATQEEKKPKVPYKHIPVHAGIDALAATPSSMGSSELREKIAAARRSRSVSSASAPAYRSGASFYHGQAGSSPTSRSHPASIISSPSHSRNGSLGKRTNSDLSISTMMQSQQETPSRGRQPARNDHFSHPSGIPAVPQLPAQHRLKTVSSRSSVAKRRSPLSAMSITEDDAGEASGEASASSAEHSDASVASSQSSATEISRPNSSQEYNKDMTKDISRENNYSRPLSTVAPAASKPMEVPQTQHKKHQSVVEISVGPELMKKKSMKQRFSLFSRKSMVVAAH